MTQHPSRHRAATLAATTFGAQAEDVGLLADALARAWRDARDEGAVDHPSQDPAVRLLALCVGWQSRVLNSEARSDQEFQALVATCSRLSQAEALAGRPAALDYRRKVTTGAGHAERISWVITDDTFSAAPTGMSGERVRAAYRHGAVNPGERGEYALGWRQFRLLDAEGAQLFQGVAHVEGLPEGHEALYAPLEDFAGPVSACTRIEYKGADGRWWGVDGSDGAYGEVPPSAGKDLLGDARERVARRRAALQMRHVPPEAAERGAYAWYLDVSALPGSDTTGRTAFFGPLSEEVPDGYDEWVREGAGVRFRVLVPGRSALSGRLLAAEEDYRSLDLGAALLADLDGTDSLGLDVTKDWIVQFEGKDSVWEACPGGGPPEPEVSFAPSGEARGGQYAWVIDRDVLYDQKVRETKDDLLPGPVLLGEAGTTGPRQAPATLLARLAAGDGRRFRMFDDDGELYYLGRILTSKDDAGGEVDLSPLDDFGEPNAGCTSIEYRSADGRWEAL